MSMTLPLRYAQPGNRQAASGTVGAARRQVADAVLVRLLAFDQSEDEQQDARADGRDDDVGQPPGSDRRKLERSPEPATDDRTDHADDDVADQAEAAALHDLSGEPASHQADQD